MDGSAGSGLFRSHTGKVTSAVDSVCDVFAKLFKELSSENSEIRLDSFDVSIITKVSPHPYEVGIHKISPEQRLMPPSAIPCLDVAGFVSVWSRGPF